MILSHLGLCYFFNLFYSSPEYITSYLKVLLSGQTSYDKGLYSANPEGSSEVYTSLREQTGDAEGTSTMSEHCGTLETLLPLKQ